MKRREFVTLLGGAAAWPLAARAQQRDRVRRIGWLIPVDENDPVVKPVVAAFIQALADLGWADGRNVRIDLRWGSGDINQIRAFAQELVGLQPDIILTSNRGDRCRPAGDADDPNRPYRRDRSRAEDLCFRVHTSACGLGLDRSPQPADGLSLGRR